MKTKETPLVPSESKRLFPKVVAAIGLALLGATLAAQAAQGPQPSICVRSCWGARAQVCNYGYMGSLTRATIHHTAGTGDWTTDYETGKAKVRGIQNYHMDTKGWCDIAYHFLVNAGGHIYEGRTGSMSLLPIGTHDAVNTSSFGFTFMGYFHPIYNQNPTTAGRNALYDVIAWRMPSIWSPYGGGTYGGRSGVGFLCGHRDASASACPGDGLYAFITTDLNGGEARNGVNARKNGGLKAPAMFYNTGGVNTYLWSSTGSAFSYVSTTSLSGYDLNRVGQNLAAADVNGDGKTDNVLAYQYPDGTMRLHVFLNGNSYQGDAGWYQNPGAFTMTLVDGRMVGGDFNGDGKGDVAMFKANGGGLDIYRYLSTGSSFTRDVVTVATSGYSMSQVMDNICATDVNGDGTTDIVTAYQYGDGTMRLHVFLNGNSYQGSAGWYQSNPYAFTMSFVNGRMVGGDFNGDGKGDVAMFKANGGGLEIFRYLSTGSSFTRDMVTVATSGYDMANVGKHVAAGNINGDGTADAVVAYQYGDGTFRYHTFLNGNSYQGPTGWYQSGTFSLANVGGRMTMGNW